MSSRAISDAIAKVRAEAAPKAADETPSRREIVVPETQLDPDDLPRGPKMVANKVQSPWSAVWYRTVVEDPDKPAQAGESFGMRLYHEGRVVGWATWLYGTFAGAVVGVPGWSGRVLKAKELKEMLDGH